ELESTAKLEAGELVGGAEAVRGGNSVGWIDRIGQEGQAAAARSDEGRQILIDVEGFNKVQIAEAGQAFHLEVFAAAHMAAGVDFRATHRLRVGDADFTRNQSREGDDQGLFLHAQGIENGPGQERITAGIRLEGVILVSQWQIESAGIDGKMVVPIKPDAA